MADSVISVNTSDVEKEEVLDRMLTRLALTDDSKLEGVLPKLLPYSISCLSSESPSIRKKVMEILTHLNKRVKLQLSIRLPLLDLWKSYVEVDAAPIVKNFCIIYIEMAFERLATEEKADLAPNLVADISKFPLQHQDILLRIVMKVIGDCHAHEIDESTALKYTRGGDKDKELFVEFCLLTILYQPSSSIAGGGCSPGLSVAQTNRIIGKLPPKGDQLLSIKLGILNVVEAVDLDVQLAYPLYLAASSDSQEMVIKRGEELLRKSASRVNLEDPNLINKLFLLFIGTVAGENTSAESRITPVNSAFKVRLLSIFCRSITAANKFPLTLQCIFNCIFGTGATPRLKQLGMEFTVWVFKHAVLDQLKLMGPIILSGILKSLDAPNTSGSDLSVWEIKTFSFQAIGLLSHRMPELFREKIEMAARLFDALKGEDQLLRPTVQEATNALSVAYKGAPTSILKDLEMLILQNSQAIQSEARFCALRWATSLFGLQHCPSRFVCMLGAADEKLDIREIALEGLLLSKDQDQAVSSQSDIKYPKLNEMLGYICSQQPRVLSSTESRDGSLLFSLKTYIAMIKFLLKIYEVDFDKDVLGGETPDLKSSFDIMCLLLEHAMAHEGSTELHAIAAKGLVTIASRSPEMMATRYAGKVTWFRQFLGHINPETRECTARLMGITCFALSSSEASALISDLCSSLNGTNSQRYESFHGAICTLGYVVAQCRTGKPDVGASLVQRSVQVITELVRSESLSLASVAMEALGHIGLYGPLPLLNDSVDAGVLTTLHERLSKLLCGDDLKAVQRVLISLGHVSFKETSVSSLNLALELIFSLCRSKVEEVLFAAGEGLSFIWGGVPVTADKILRSNYTSLSFCSNYLTGEIPSFASGSGTDVVDIDDEAFRVLVRDTITKKLFDELLYSSRKEERCAGTIWLLSLTMYCGRGSKIQELLPQIQEAFSHLLGDQNDLTQELASQGMSIVYEIGNTSMKRDLVNALVGALTGKSKRKKAIKLTEDSEVFEEGSISQSPSGGKLNTYKELCNLANEMGQPDLIYKFMDLANYQASLNSKRGAAFGFSKIAKQAGEALQPYLRLLVPRLVRYQYDPDKNVQDAMGHIWKFLVTDPKKAIDEYFDDIIDDLLLQSGSRLWRSREASCIAIADVIQGRKFTQISNYLRKIWIAAFRAMDDIKETVRIAGERLCRSISSLSIRLCDASLTGKSDARLTMEIVLPFLLGEGIVSKVVDIQKASISMVMKLSKGAGDVIRPHLPDLIYCMLESLSSLEDQRMNYIELHSANVGIHSEKLENLRVSVAKESPMWETLDACLKVIDVGSLDLLVPRLAQLVRSGVGLNTRVGVASFTSLLVQTVGADIKPFTSTLLKILFPATQGEKSGIAKRAFAVACGNLVNHAASSQVQKLIEETATLHTGDKNAQLSCAILLKSYVHLASDVASGYHSIIVPVVFVSRFDDNKDVQDLFEELWEEISSSESVTLQLYLSEIVSLLSECMMSSSWVNKKKSAKAIRRLSDVLGESLSVFHQNLLKCLLQEMLGRLWEGKETILYAIAALCTSCHKAMRVVDPSTPHTVVKAMSSACMKKLRSYRDAAFFSLQQVVKAFGDPEFFNMVLPLLVEVCDSNALKHKIPSALGDMTQTGEDTEEDKFSLPVDKVIDCVAACINVAHIQDIIEHRKELINIFHYAFSPSFTWTVKLSVLSSIKELSVKLNNFAKSAGESSKVDMASFVNELFHSLTVKVIECIKTVKIAQVHVSSSECLLKMIEVYQDMPMKQVEVELNAELIHLLEMEKNELSKSLLKKCIECLGGANDGDR